MKFVDFFIKMTKKEGSEGLIPYCFQTKNALSLRWNYISVPTGCGKTEAVVLAWLWRRRGATEEVKNSTPRRLVYCLPTRTLVEQTVAKIRDWLDKLEDPPISVILMGGGDEEDWYHYPEREMVLVGTQDMLLSRALNRGYGAVLDEWPPAFGLLNNDCLWVVDEVQLSGVGLITALQLDAFRRSCGTMLPCRTIYMSATIMPEWFEGSNVKKIEEGDVLCLDKNDLKDPELLKRANAEKTLHWAGSSFDDPEALAKEIAGKHTDGTLSLVVVNTVGRAINLYRALAEKRSNVILLHSHFRQKEKENKMERLKMKQPAPKSTQPSSSNLDLILVSTQSVEAGVDVSAKVLFTEVAPWESLVQRLGRCNRYGCDQNAEAFFIRLPTEKEDSCLPYSAEQIKFAIQEIDKRVDQKTSPLELTRSLKSGVSQLDFTQYQRIRQKDVYELFDTQQDLSGNVTDVSQFVRDVTERNAHVFWRNLSNFNPEMRNHPRPAEICPAPLSDITGEMGSGRARVFDYVTEEWVQLERETNLYPGILVMMNAEDGGYSEEIGWDPGSTAAVAEVTKGTVSKGLGRFVKSLKVRDLRIEKGGRMEIYVDDGIRWKKHIEKSNDLVARRLSELLKGEQDDKLVFDGIDAYEAEEFRNQERKLDLFNEVNSPDPKRQKLAAAFYLLCYNDWETLEDHSDAVAKKMKAVLDAFGPVGIKNVNELLTAARWHDAGKAHQTFQRRPADVDKLQIPSKFVGKLMAKYPGKNKPRDGLRHELVSAMLSVSAGNADLVSFLVAAHHGHVRMSIKSIPGRKEEGEERLWAHGVLDGESVGKVNLGGGVVIPPQKISLSPMLLGDGKKGEKSWLARTTSLLDEEGPFRLAFMEALLRSADVRASRGEP